MNERLLVTSLENNVFEVTSEQNPKVKYRVEVTENNGLAKCACADHRIRRQKNIDAAMMPLTRATMCKHVEAVAIHWCRHAWPLLAKIEAMAKSESER